MRWKYKLIFENERFYQYAYSRESDKLDGIIQYDKDTGKRTILKYCTADGPNKIAAKKAIEHFGSVIESNFPKDCYVCCG